jgi:hypothetical protein
MKLATKTRRVERHGAGSRERGKDGTCCTVGLETELVPGGCPRIESEKATHITKGNDYNFEERKKGQAKKVKK